MEPLELDRYNNNLKKHIAEVIDYFPLLKINPFIPLINQPKRLLKGPLLPKTLLDQHKISYEDLVKINYPIINVCVEIPYDYIKKGCIVFDENNAIDWNKVPYEHRHNNGKGEFGNIICSHLPQEVKDMDNPILENLRTTYRLFVEYCHFLKTGVWNLKEYSHGDEGVKEYERSRMQRKAK